jgi:hypothetical protein
MEIVFAGVLETVFCWTLDKNSADTVKQNLFWEPSISFK